MKKTWTRTVIALALCMTMVCGLAVYASAAGEDPIVIGSIQDLTGSAADAGVSALWGAEYAVQQINDNGGINGRELQLVSMDCGGDVQQAITCYRRLVEEDHVSAIVGPSLSNVGIALAPLTTEDEIPMVGHYIDESATTDEETGEAYPFMFLACPGNSQQAYSLAQYCLDELGYESFSALYNEGNAFSVKLVESFLEYVEANGGTVITPETFTYADQDYRAQAVKLANAAPDVIMSPNYTYFDSMCYSQLREAGFEGGFAGPNTLAPPFQYMVSTEVKDVYYLINVDMNSGECAELLDKYVEDTGNQRMWNVCFGYDDVKILENAMSQVDDVTDGAAIADIIANSSVETVSGTITMDPEIHRPVGMPMYIADYDEDNQFRVIAEIWQDEDPSTAGELELLQ